MEKIKILGIDPSLRNTGLAIVSYNTELDPNDSKSYEISHCQVLVNPRKYTGTEAILNMLDMMNEESQKEAYKSASNVIVESPASMFNKKISSSVVASLAHISGGAVALKNPICLDLVSGIKQEKKKLLIGKPLIFWGTLIYGTMRNG